VISFIAVKTCAQCSVNYPDALEYCPRDGNKLPPSPGDTRALYDPMLGSTIDGRYIVEALLGQGGMGFVYAARHAIIDKRVAIKVLRKEAAKDETAAQRFIAEAKAASKIGHQNIVDITDFGVLPDRHAYFVMEFLDGPTLAKMVSDHGQLDPQRAIAIAIQIARGLWAAHQKGIIHRDLKPENIFVLERDGQSDVVKIVDFGIAKDATSGKRLTQAGMVLGTPEYMSPEQATGQPSDQRVDMYALGCILYELLTGDVPFKGETATRTLTMHVYDAVEPPSKRRPELAIPPALEAVVMRTLQKKREDRYADLRELMNELDRVSEELRTGVSSAPSTAAAPPPAAVDESAADFEDSLARRSGLRERWVAAGAAAAFVVVVGGLLLRRPAPAPASSTASTAIVAAPPASAPPVATPPAAAPPAPAPPAAAPPAEVELVLRTLPPGADVYFGDERLGSAPLHLRRPRGDAPLSFSFRRAGFRDASRAIVPDHDFDVEVTLTPRQKVAASAPRRPASAAAPTAKAPTKLPPGHVSDLRNPFE
jgi:serine/threonine-protein kinase